LDEQNQPLWLSAQYRDVVMSRYGQGRIGVIGPARGTSGAEYKLRYPEIEKWLIPAKGEGYLSR
jgi:hypothetical protein